MVPTAYASPLRLGLDLYKRTRRICDESQPERHGNAGNVFSFVFGSEMRFLAAKKQRFMFCHSVPLMSPSIAFFGPDLLFRIRQCISPR